MSEQDRFDWNEEDFESLADETQPPEVSDFESLADENSMISDEAMEQELLDESPGQESAEEPASAVDSAPEAVCIRDSGSKRSGAGLGFLFGFSTLVASLGLGGAMLFVLGGNPLSLWDPSGLMQVDQWLNYQDHPLNILYIVGLGTVLLAILGSWVVARAAAGSNRNLHAAESMLSRICTLRLDDEKAWQSPVFKKDAAASSFVNETLGAWRLQQSRQKKYLGLEGEFSRLQKAIQDNQRGEISGSFENFIVGSMADEVGRLFDERERALEEVGSVRNKDQHESESIIGIIQDARTWNRQALDQVGVQGSTLDRVSSRMDQLKNNIDAAEKSSDSVRNKNLLTSARQQLDAWQQSSNKGEVSGDLNGLLDRANKLAFQIAMEVARLGSRGERLLPMTQSLDELNTELRQVSSSLGNAPASGNDPQWIQLQAQFDALAASLAQSGADPLKKANDTATELGTVTANIGQQLADIARSFNQQGDRLVKLGESCSELTGVAFESGSVASGNAQNPPEGGLNISQFDPFGSEDDEESITEDVDPFATGDISLPEDNVFEKSGDFNSSVIPGENLPLISQEDEPALDSEDEKVYDLSEFGAVPVQLDAAPVADEIDDQVYDLSEFGAVTMS